MQSLRTLRSTRLTALRTPAMMSRGYANGRAEGATASSDSFKKREEASESQYIKNKEKEALQQAIEKRDKAQKEVDEHQKKVDQHKE